MNKNAIYIVLAVMITFMLPVTVSAQSREYIPGQTRSLGPVELKAVPEASRPAGTLLKPLKTSPLPVADAASSFYGRKLYGALINSTEWVNATITNVPYGLYSFEMGPSPVMTNHINDFIYNFVSGAYGRGKFFGVAMLSVMGALNGARYITVDTDSWTETKNIMYGTDNKGYGLLPTAMAYNPVDDRIYSFQYKDDLSGLDWCVYNDEYAEFDKIASFRGKYNVLTLAATSGGDMYFINSYGDLYKINRATGRPTFIEWTGVTPLLYSQSMTYDGRTGMFLWAAQSSDGSALYTVDPSTAETTKIISFSNAEQFSAIYSVDNEAPDAAPAQIQNLTLAYNAPGSLEGTVTFDIPATTYGGDPLGSSTLDVWLDGVNLKGTDAVPGEHVSIPVTLTEGNHYIMASLGNAGGRSPITYVYQYAGYDTPETVGQVTFSHDSATGRNNVSWTASESGKNDGFIDYDNLSYTVVRMPDSVTVADGCKECSFSEPVPDAMHNYSYRVYAVNNGKRSDYTESETVICGNAFTVPYSQSFADKTAFTDFFTVVDANKDGNTWRAGYNNDLRIDLSSNNPEGDDWLITPSVDMTETAMYRFTMNVKTFSKGYPEDFEILIGTDPSDLTTFNRVASEESFELYEAFGNYSADFFIEHPGRYYLALRYLSNADRNGSMLLLNSIAVTKVGAAKAPAAVTDLVITPDKDDAMSAEVSFTAPVKALDGEDLRQITRINIYRNGVTEPVYTFNSPDTGAALSFNDTRVDKVGVNEYTVVGENEAGIGAETSASAFIGIFSAPYLETFDTKDAADLYQSTVTGIQESNMAWYCWKYNNNTQRMSFYAFNSNDDDRAELWLYTPKMRLDANSVYSFSYKTSINLYTNTITNKVYMGADATPESQTTFVGDMPSNTNYQMKTVAHNVVTTDAGKFRFGFHSLGTAKNDYLSVDLDDIALTYLKSAFSPYAFTDWKAEPDMNGNLSVSMEAKAPDTDYHGNSLTGYLKVEIYRGQNPVPVFTKEDVAPGAVVKWTDTQAQHGNNIYMIVAQNAYGRSEVITDTVFAGRDLPVIVENLTCKATPDNKDAVLVWDAPSQGANGGVIVGSELAYNIYSYNIEDNTLTPVKEGVKECTFTVENESSDEQKVVYYAVSAVNTEGESRAVATQVTLGRLYSMPFKESFTAKELSTTPWTVSTSNGSVLSWGITNPDGQSYNSATPQDDDGGVAYMYNGNYYETFAGAAFISPKISIGADAAVLKFWVYNIATAYPDNKPVIEVYVRADDDRYQPAGRWIVGSDTEDGWTEYEVSLDKYAGSSFISLAFYGYTGGHNDVIYLDNITVDKTSSSSTGLGISDSGQIKEIRYFDVGGRELKIPQSGVCIRTVTYTDGTMKSGKVILK